MDNLFTMFGLVFLILCLSALAKSPWFKGVLGEFVVNLSARWMLPNETYRIIKNVTLSDNQGGTTQIDHIIVSKFGVFVLETKNMKGWIFGSERQKQWTQKIFKHSSKFQNPLHQNYKHVKAIQSLLELPSNTVFSLVVFVGDAVLKSQMPDNVKKGIDYIGFIKSKKESFFDDDKVEEIVSLIEQGRLSRSLKTNREHVKYVRKIVQEKEQA